MSTGVWCDMGGAGVVELLAASGVEWLGIDAQHGTFDDREIRLAVAACADLPCRVHVRVLQNDDAAIGRALDAGAAGVIVPMIGSAADAARAVAACRYPPLGRRSWGPLRGAHGRAVPDPVAANTAVSCAAMVETRGALDEVDAIAAVDGVDMIFVGPHDLSLALGTTVDELLAGDGDDAPLRRIVAACTTNGKVAGAFAGNRERAARLSSLGFTTIAAATVSGMLAEAARSLP